MLNITEGIIRRPLKALIYGSEGIGKTTLAAEFPEPLFIDTEGGTAQLNVRRVGRPASWTELLSIVKEVAETPGICKTLVLDTADWAEALCISHVCAKYNQSSIESFGYGKGYTYLAEEFSHLIKAFDQVIQSGKNVVITAHAKMRKFEQPDEQGAYDRWEMKLTRQVAPLLKEWCDMLLFLNYKTYVVTTENNTKKGTGGKRVMYATHHPCWDAKNRHGMPDEMDLDFKYLAPLFQDTPVSAPKKAEPIDSPEKKNRPIDHLHTLMERDGISEEEIQEVVASKGHYAIDVPIESYHEEFIAKWVLRYWPRIKEMIQKNRERSTEK